MEALLATHHSTLKDLYGKLSPSPEPLISDALSSLSAQLEALLLTQRTEIEAKLADISAQLDKSWTQVGEWREALGDPSTAGRGDGPLLSEVEAVEGVLGGMRGRMKDRGELVVEVQTRLKGLEQWITVGVELEDLSSGWEGLDLKVSRLESLQKELGRCEAELAQRREVLNLHTTEIFQLRTELGVHLSLTALPAGAALATAEHPHNPHGCTFPIEDQLDQDILDHIGAFKDRPVKPLEPTSAVLAAVEAKWAWLEEEKDHRNGIIQRTYDSLHGLWTMLNVSDKEMDGFVDTWMGSTADVVHAYQTELQRMLVLKRSNLAAFIQKEREALTKLWDMLYLSFPARIDSFPGYSTNISPTLDPVTGHERINDNMSEELLAAHEKEREKLEQEVVDMEPVLERLRKYFEVVGEMRELEESAADPMRLLGKGAGGAKRDPGRLLREEKARKRVAIQKPKLEAELKSLIPQWEHAHDKPLLVNGARFLDELERAQEAENAEKENKKRAKLGQSTSSRDTVVPLRAQKTGSAPQPLKRQMTGTSTASSVSTSSRAPLAKRQVPMHTGSTVRSVSSAAKPAQREAVQAPARLVSQPTGGMNLPGGWGSASTSAASAQPHPIAAGGGVARPGFRPGGAR